MEIALLRVLNQVLRSRDIQQAAAQAETDEYELQKLVSSHAEELLAASAPVDSLDFHERIDLREILSSSAVGARAGAALALIAVAVTVDLDPWGFGWWVLAPADLVLTAIAGIILLPVAASIDDFRGPLEPTPQTRDQLARVVIEPFVREHLNRMIDEADHPPVMHVTSAPGLSELGSRERMVPTNALRALGRLCRTIMSGSIGVSGPRGAGKTTLLRYFSDPSFRSKTEETGAVNSAPR